MIKHGITERILSTRWSRFTFTGDDSECYVGETAIIWRGQKIIIKIRSFWGHGLGGLRTHYNFLVDGVDYSFRMIDSYMKGRSGSIPRLEKENLKLSILALPDSLLITEQEKV